MRQDRFRFHPSTPDYFGDGEGAGDGTDDRSGTGTMRAGGVYRSTGRSDPKTTGI
jgi:hypothetical protein